MMTPSDIRQYEFKAAGRNAYKAEDVDSFFAEVLVNYEKMYRENSELIKRISLLADRLETYKKDEVDIKQAVLSAQKAADIIVRDAEESVADAKQEAEAILAAAKGEAVIIKSDAEKQAIADSDLLLSIARDKAEDILNKAKEKAHGILIAANDSASNTVGAATRTITSESIHYDMLKKEVSEFRASILAQYKAQIELISKLPEMAIEEAAKIEETPAINSEAVSEIVDEIVAAETQAVTENVVNEEEYLEIVDTPDVEDYKIDEQDNLLADESVETAQPIDFDENVEAEAEDNVDVAFSDDDFNKTEPADIPISRGFSISSVDFDFSGFEEEEAPAEIEDASEIDDFRPDSFSGFEEESAEAETGTNGEGDSFSSFFDTIENVETQETEDEPPKTKRGFFRRRK